VLLVWLGLWLLFLHNHHILIFLCHSSETTAYHYSQKEVDMRTTKMQVFLIVISVLFSLLISSHSLSFQNEPDGFREHKWGIKFESFRVMTLIVGDDDVDGFIGDRDTKAYSQANDELHVENVPVSLIAYYFYKKKLGAVTINFETKKNFEQLKNILASRHGPGSQHNPYYNQMYERLTREEPPGYREMYWWIGKNGYIRIQYNDARGCGTIEYIYMDVVLKEEYEKAVKAYSNNDFKEAKKYLLICAKNGERTSSAAQALPGYMYEKGHGFDRDCGQAIFWYRLAAEAMNSFGLTRLGWMYDSGCGVQKNYHQALEYYRKAAKQGFAQAQYNMGSMYEHGSGVQKDIRKAESWYKKAAQQNHQGIVICFGW